MGQSFSTTSRAVFSSLIALALLLRALIPAGFMPDMKAEAGVFQMEICTSSGYAVMPVPADAGDSHEKGSHPPCPFAPVFADGLMRAPLVFHRALPAAVLVSFIVAVPRGNSPRPYFSQGPPSS